MKPSPATLDARTLHDRLGAMIDQIGQPDYSLRELVEGLREVRDSLLVLSETATRDYALLLSVAKRIRDAFTYDPGHSDLDNEQPIHILVTLREWRELNYALNALPERPE